MNGIRVLAVLALLGATQYAKASPERLATEIRPILQSVHFRIDCVNLQQREGENVKAYMKGL